MEKGFFSKNDGELATTVCRVVCGGTGVAPPAVVVHRAEPLVMIEGPLGMPGRARWEGAPTRPGEAIVRWSGHLAFQLGVISGRLFGSVRDSQGSCFTDRHRPRLSSRFPSSFHETDLDLRCVRRGWPCGGVGLRLVGGGGGHAGRVGPDGLGEAIAGVAGNAAAEGWGVVGATGPHRCDVRAGHSRGAHPRRGGAGGPQWQGGLPQGLRHGRQRGGPGTQARRHLPHRVANQGHHFHRGDDALGGGAVPPR